MSEKITPQMRAESIEQPIVAPEPAAPAAGGEWHPLSKAVTALSVVATIAALTAVVRSGDTGSSDEHMAALARQNTSLKHKLAEQARVNDSVVGLLAAQNNVSKDTIERKGLGKVEDLPGYGQEVSPTDSAKLSASVVKIATIPKSDLDNETGSWFDNCTGLKISVGGRNYVATARHCFENGVDMTELYPIKGGVTQTDRARDIRKVSTSDYGIKTVMDDEPVSLPVAPVTGISIRYAPDIALLSINESNMRSTLYDKVPAVSYDRTLELPKPGASTVGFSMPGSSGEKLIEGKGIYLGRIPDPSDTTKLVDLVAIDPETPTADACNFGASGSAAVIAGGYITGPLSSRDNITNNETTNPGDDPAGQVPYRYKLEDALHLDLSKYSTICEFAVVDQLEVVDLVAGLHRPAHLYTYPGDSSTEGPKG